MMRCASVARYNCSHGRLAVSAAAAATAAAAAAAQLTGWPVLEGRRLSVRLMKTFTVVHGRPSTTSTGVVGHRVLRSNCPPAPTLNLSKILIPGVGRLSSSSFAANCAANLNMFSCRLEKRTCLWPAGYNLIGDGFSGDQRPLRTARAFIDESFDTTEQQL